VQTPPLLPDLLWIEESNQRFYAYNHFGRHPERLIGCFDRHLVRAQP
jgi:hypothetical protein